MRKTWMSLLLVLLLAFPLVLVGCNGEDGKDGRDGLDGMDGQNGTNGQDGQDGLDGNLLISIVGDEPETLNFEVTGITIASPPVVTFSVTDIVGRGAVGLGDSTGRRGLDWVRFVMAKLVPGVDGEPDDWVRYTYERNPDGLVDNGDGTYTYTFDQDLGDYEDGVTYEPDRTHRLAIQSSGGTWERINLIYDFVPSQLPGPFTLPLTKDVVTTAACNECHGELRIHGNRIETKFCVTCHTPDLDEGNGNFMVMVHAIHAGDMRENPYELGGDDFSHVVFPQDLRHCTKCHKGPDPNWQTRPTMEACGACHDDVDFSSTEDHPVVQVNNVACHLCHTPDVIQEQHITDNATPNNPMVPEGAVNFTYEIADATVDDENVAVVKFRILMDGTPVEFNPYSDGADMLTGFGRSPGFLLAWALPQDESEEPTEYNNLGNEAAQPSRVDIDDLWSGASGSLSGPDLDGYYTATISAAPFPQGAMMRAVALQGYFSQDDPDVSRHTVSVYKPVTGDDARRDIVDSAKCANCHEWFEGHGGNRVYTVQVCAFCHVPNLTSSGRTADLTEYQYGTNSSTDATIDALGWDPLLYPEDTNNLKDMIHGIHSAHDRSTDYEFVRLRGGNVYYYNWSHVAFPTDANKCETCHMEDTYLPDNIPAAALWTNTRTTTGNPAETRGDIETAREEVPNETDVVNTTLASTCYYCHDSADAVEHMEQNGGAIRWSRDDVLMQQPYPTCLVCHGEGRIAAVEDVHEDD